MYFVCKLLNSHSLIYNQRFNFFYGFFSFVGSWNQLFLPSILLTDPKLYTMPLMVSLLKGDIYKVEYGAVYLGLTLSVLPLFVIYFLLSKYIIAGVALGGVKG